MSQELWAVSAIIGGICGYTFASVLSQADALLVPAWVVALVASVVVVAIWLYSPLPNRTVHGGPGGPMGDTQAGYWGFSRPDDEN